MICSFNNFVEMKNKVIIKMNKYNLVVAYSDISEHIGKYNIRVVMGIHYIHRQN